MASVAADDAQREARYAAVDRLACTSSPLHPTVTHDSTTTKQHYLGGPIRDFAVLAGAQNGATEASFDLDGGEWLLAVIEALVAFEKLRATAVLTDHSRLCVNSTTTSRVKGVAKETSMLSSDVARTLAKVEAEIDMMMYCRW